MKKLRITVDHARGEVTIKRGLFGRKAIYDEKWFVQNTLNEMVADFISGEVDEFTQMACKDVRVEESEVK